MNVGLEFIASIDGFVNASKSIGRIEFLATESHLSWPRTEIWSHRGNVSTNRSSASEIERSQSEEPESQSRVFEPREVTGKLIIEETRFTVSRISFVEKRRQKKKILLVRVRTSPSRTTLLFCFPLVVRKDRKTHWRSTMFEKHRNKICFFLFFFFIIFRILKNHRRAFSTTGYCVIGERCIIFRVGLLVCFHTNFPTDRPVVSRDCARKFVELVARQEDGSCEREL